MEAFGLEPCLALVLLIVVAGISASPHTYQWTDLVTGKELTCHQCPKGTFVAKHCTSTKETDCQPCPEQHYTSYWNYVEKCRFCNIICEDREQVKHECNSTHNRVCECKPGYLRRSYDCVRDCSKLVNIDDSECDEEVIEFVANQNLSHRNYQRLLGAATMRESLKRNITPKKIRILLKQIKKHEPNHALLPQLLELVKEANMTHLEKELKKRFLGYNVTNLQ